MSSKIFELDGQQGSLGCLFAQVNLKDCKFIQNLSLYGYEVLFTTLPNRNFGNDFALAEFTTLLSWHLSILIYTLEAICDKRNELMDIHGDHIVKRIL